MRAVWRMASESKTNLINWEKKMRSMTKYDLQDYNGKKDPKLPSVKYRKDDVLGKAGK